MICFLLCLALVSLRRRPSVEGCNGSVVYPAQYLANYNTSGEPSTALEIAFGTYSEFAILWPYFFGLTVAVVSLLAHRHQGLLQLGWITWAFLIGLHALTLFLFLGLHFLYGEQPTGLSDISFIAVTLATIVVALLTLRCHNWFNSVAWLQATLGLAAAINLSTVSLWFTFSQRVLFGWQLALFSSICIALHGLVMRMAGVEVVLPKFEPYPRFQLSLRNMLILMLVGGVACAWMGSGLMLNEAAEMVKQARRP